MYSLPLEPSRHHHSSISDLRAERLTPSTPSFPTLFHRSRHTALDVCLACRINNLSRVGLYPANNKRITATSKFESSYMRQALREVLYQLHEGWRAEGSSRDPYVYVRDPSSGQWDGVRPRTMYFWRCRRVRPGPTRAWRSRLPTVSHSGSEDANTQRPRRLLTWWSYPRADIDVE